MRSHFICKTAVSAHDGSHGIRAKVVVSGHALPAGHARMRAPAQPDGLARGQMTRPLADGFYISYDFMAGYKRIPGYFCQPLSSMLKSLWQIPQSLVCCVSITNVFKYGEPLHGSEI
jgi:hypothetical protein